MARYRITVAGGGAVATIPNESRALHHAEEIGRGFARAYPGQVVTVEKNDREADENTWRLETQFRGEEVTRIEARNLGRVPVR